MPDLKPPSGLGCALLRAAILYPPAYDRRPLIRHRIPEQSCADMCAVLPPCAFSTQREDIPMEFVDRALARRLESCEEIPQVLYARIFSKTRPEIGAAEAEICGGHMVFAGLGSPIGRAT